MEKVEWKKREIMGVRVPTEFIVFTLWGEEKEKGTGATQYEGTVKERGENYVIVKIARPVSLRGKFFKFLLDEIHILRRYEEVDWGRKKKGIFGRW